MHIKLCNECLVNCGTMKGDKRTIHAETSHQDGPKQQPDFGPFLTIRILSQAVFGCKSIKLTISGRVSYCNLRPLFWIEDLTVHHNFVRIVNCYMKSVGAFRAFCTRLRISQSSVHSVNYKCST